VSVSFNDGVVVMTTTTFAAEARAPRRFVNTSVRTVRNAAARFVRPSLYCTHTYTLWV